MMVFGFIFWILILVGIVLLVKWLVEQSKVGATTHAGETALDILKRDMLRARRGMDQSILEIYIYKRKNKEKIRLQLIL